MRSEPRRSDTEPAPHPRPLQLTDLLLDLDEIVGHLVRCVRAGDSLDSFLLAAAAVQVVEDQLQADPLALRRAAGYLGGPAGAGFAGAAALAEAATRSTRRHQALLRWCQGARRLRDALADAVTPEAVAVDLDRCVRAAEALAHHAPGGAEPMRLPSCFRGHGMLPADAVTLADRYAAGLEPGREVRVVGIRTSGSYLAPLVAAALRAGGRPAVTTSTRPGHPLLATDAADLRGALARGAAVAVVDDPPGSGGAFRATAELLRRAGVPAGEPTLLVPLFDALPPALRDYRRVELPYPEWAIHRRLTPAAIAEALSELWGAPVTAVATDIETADRSRHHVGRVVHVRSAGRTVRVEAGGAGVGFLGRHALAVAEALPNHVVPVLGFRDGVVLRRWLPPAAGDTAPSVEEQARYVRDRAAALPARRDRAAGLAGRAPVWEQAARLLSGSYGRLGVGLRLPVLDPLARSLCAVERPSVVDGATGPEHWRRDGTALRKDRADDLAFANFDRACYDPVFDLAGVDPGSADPERAAALRAACPSIGAGDPERYLLYQLVHLLDPEMGRTRDPCASGRAVLGYLTERLPAPATRAGDGAPLWALDLDGVLETGALGFSMPTPATWDVVRAALAHGYRPVPVTGRSLGEIRDRCTILGLAGGVAEYGSVVYTRAGDTTVCTLDPADVEDLDRLRTVLAGVDGVEVDAAHRHTVRARHLARSSRGRALPGDVVTAAFEAAGTDPARFRVVHGMRQTDIVAAPADKGRGLDLLADRLGAAGPAPVAAAVGDSAEDLPMLARADRAFAPANASPEVRAAGVTVLRAPYAAGVKVAATRLLGHRPGRCPTCRPADPDPEARALLTVLDGSHAGRRGLPQAVLRVLAGRLLAGRR